MPAEFDAALSSKRNLSNLIKSDVDLRDPVLVCRRGSMVEQSLRKGEVGGSTPLGGS